jgi:citrate synthase
LLGYEGAGEYISWGNTLAQLLRPHNYGWLMPGLAAAAFLDLGFHPRVGAGLYQLMAAPGILAHGLEMMNKSRTAMPLVSEDKYIYEGTDNG